MMELYVFHDYAEIFLQISGTTIFSFPYEEIQLTEGTMLIVPPELPHREIVGKGESRFETIVITPAQNYFQCHISRESKLGTPIISYYEENNLKEVLEIRQLTELLIEAGNFTDTYSLTISQGLLMALLASTGRLLSGFKAISREHNKITEVKNTVLSQYHHNFLSVAYLARQINCSADYLSWLFHKETGETLNRYITHLRMKRSADLLKNTDYTISEISWICGYKTPAYFSRAFSRYHSYSPGKFRMI